MADHSFDGAPDGPAAPANAGRASDLIEHLAQQVFPGVLASEPSMCAAIAAFDGELLFDGSELVFTLPALHDFLQADLMRLTARVATATQAGYVPFRRALYASQLNARLRQQGGVVVVEQAHGEHRLTRYRLRRHTPD